MIRARRQAFVAISTMTAFVLLARAPGAAPAATTASTAATATAASPPRAPAPSSGAEAGAAIRRMIGVLLEETNRNRAEKHLAALTLSADLSRAAQAHAEDMLARGYFAHESPEGETSAERVARLAPRAIVLSVRENILRSEGHEDDTPEVRAVDVIDGWMDSPGHRANLMAGDVAEAGFGIASKMVKGRLIECSVQVLGRTAGAWKVSPMAVRVPEKLLARLTLPVEFFLEDTAHPKRRYKDPYDAALSWVGGMPLVVVNGAGGAAVELPRLDPGRYRLLGRLARDDGYQALREIRVLGAFDQG